MSTSTSSSGVEIPSALTRARRSSSRRWWPTPRRRRGSGPPPAPPTSRRRSRPGTAPTARYPPNRPRALPSRSRNRGRTAGSGAASGSAASSSASASASSGASSSTGGAGGAGGAPASTASASATTCSAWRRARPPRAGSAGACATGWRAGGMVLRRCRGWRGLEIAGGGGAATGRDQRGAQAGDHEQDERNASTISMGPTLPTAGGSAAPAWGRTVMASARSRQAPPSGGPPAPLPAVWRGWRAVRRESAVARRSPWTSPRAAW